MPPAESSPEHAPEPAPRRPRSVRIRSGVVAPLGAGEIVLAAVVALALAALVARAAWSSSAAAFAPGAAVPRLERAHAEPPVPVPGALDLAARRHTVAALAEGRMPLWNPHVAAGAPWLADPRTSVLDPEVLVAAASAGEAPSAAADAATRWFAWLRLAAAALGAYVLARRLGTSAAAAATAAIGFAGSGLFLGHVAGPPAHVAACVPWMFVALDRLRTAPLARGAAFVGLATALAGLGGSVAAFGFALAAGTAFALAALEGRARSAALAGLALGVAGASPVLLPFLAASGEATRLAAAAGSRVDVVGAGIALVTVAIVVAWRGIAHEAEEAERTRRTREFGEQMAAVVRGERPAPPAPVEPAKPWAAAAAFVGLLLSILTCAFVLARRGGAERARAWLVPDAFVRPDTSAWSDLAAFARDGAAWMPAVVVALACAACLASRGPLRARRTLQVTGLVALLVALGLAGTADAWRALAPTGTDDARGVAAVAALCASLLAAEALDAATRTARRAAALVFVSLVGLALLAAPPAPPPFAPDPEEPYFAVTERPPAGWTHGEGLVAGWVATSLPADSVALSRARIDDDGRPRGDASPAEVVALGAADAVGRRAFRARGLDATELEPGLWRFTLAFRRAGADGAEIVLGERVVAYARVERPPRLGTVSLLATMGGFLVLLFVAGAGGRTAWIAAALALAQVAFVSDRLWSGTSPAAPDATAVASLRARLPAVGVGRVLAARDVLPEGVALDLGLDDVGAGPGVALARTAALRELARLDSDPLAGRAELDPRGVDPRSNALRLLGVTHVVTRAPLEREGFERTDIERAAPAGPDAPAVSIARVPGALPRAFCVGAIVARHRAMSGTAAFDPAREAFLDEGQVFEPKRTLTRASASVERDEGEFLRVVADVDGDALLVLADAHANGWRATVDGVETPILAVDVALRGVALAPGRHVVEFEYRPRAVTWGAWLGVIAGVAFWLLTLVPVRRRVDDASPNTNSAATSAV